jgi:hypothetical protein
MGKPLQRKIFIYLGLLFLLVTTIHFSRVYNHNRQYDTIKLILQYDTDELKDDIRNTIFRRNLIEVLVTFKPKSFEEAVDHIKALIKLRQCIKDLIIELDPSYKTIEV